MNAVTKIEPAEPLSRLREPFPPHHISKLPKESRAQREEREKDRSKGISCQICGGWHHRNAVHLDYVGHAALTDRLLDVDPLWSWEPMGFSQDGTPAFDREGGLWIKLTVCGVTRLGYGCADGKKGGDAVKEIIGDALRNAAMRFGAALDLWHKGELHPEEQEPVATAEELAINLLRGASADKALFAEAWNRNKDGWKGVMDGPTYARVVAEMKRLAAQFPKDEPIPQQPATADDFGVGDDAIPDFD